MYVWKRKWNEKGLVSMFLTVIFEVSEPSLSVTE